MQVRLFPSFSGLLSMLRKGYVWVDSPDCIYMFGSMKLGIDETFQLYSRKYFSTDVDLNLTEILEKLDKAETEGRVLWRKEYRADVGATVRMEWFIAKLKSMGVYVVEDRGYESGYHNAGWNLPALTRWLDANAPTVIVVDREFGRNL